MEEVDAGTGGGDAVGVRTSMEAGVLALISRGGNGRHATGRAFFFFDRSVGCQMIRTLYQDRPNNM